MSATSISTSHQASGTSTSLAVLPKVTCGPEPGTGSSSSEIESWYRPTSQEDLIDPSEILEAVYEKTVAFGKELLKDRPKDDIDPFSGSLPVTAILAETQKAEDRYAAKKERRWRFTKKVNSGWTTSVNKIGAFNHVVDTLVSSNPEYAALAWGSIKFLFTVTLNHQELSTKVYEALAAISDALPESSFLARLYPVPHIKRTLATMHAHIIDFCIRALKWYRKVAKGFFRKAWAAVKDPWALEFEDVVRQIRGATTRLREQATVAHQAETRSMHKKVFNVEMEVRNLKKAIDEQGDRMVPEIVKMLLGAEKAALLQQPSIIKSIPFIPERMAKYFFSIPFNPAKALTIGTALRNRRRARGTSTLDPDKVWRSVKLREWISEPSSALLQLQGSVISADASRDFGLDIVDLTKQTGFPVAWYLGSPLPSTDLKQAMTATDMLRSLVQQVLDGNRDEFANSNLEEASFATCSTEEDWVRLFIGVISQLPRLIIIIDTHNDAKHILGTIRKFWELLEKSNCKTVVKMLLLTYSIAVTAMPVFLTGDNVTYLHMSLDQDRRPGTMRISMYGKGKGRRVVQRGQRGGGPELLKPYMLRLMDGGGGSQNGSG